ncbi:hypothetical protein PtB15_13B14 [Puccinia triticina]|nr:hypothetical protein PtB15_13B14 [Puccinia triticina]
MSNPESLAPIPDNVPFTRVKAPVKVQIDAEGPLATQLEDFAIHLVEKFNSFYASKADHDQKLATAIQKEHRQAAKKAADLQKKANQVAKLNSQGAQGAKSPDRQATESQGTQAAGSLDRQSIYSQGNQVVDSEGVQGIKRKGTRPVGRPRKSAKIR